jgi:phosphohistidine phosphatase
MLRLTLIRHARTEPAYAGQEDWDRALEASGQRDAPEMGKRLKDRQFKPDLVLSSPAVRALTTATIIVRELGISASKVVQDERLYLASPKDMLQVIRELGGTASHLMLFGHNPGITEFADQISSERSIDNMPTCATFTVEFDIGDWSQLACGTGVNAEFDYPRKS